MKQFFVKIIYFVVPVLLLLYPLDYLLSYVLKQSHEYPGEFEVWNDIYNSEASCDIAIYGSSRAWVNIDPKILRDSLNLKVYNFGIDGHNFWLQYLRHKEFLKYNGKPKTIVLAVDMFGLQKRADLYQLDQFLPYMLWNSNIKDFTSTYVGFTTMDYDVPLFRYSGQKKSIKTILKNITGMNSSKSFRSYGFSAIDKQWNSDLDEAKKILRTYEAKFDSSSIVLFEKFILECRVDRIELIFVYPPEYIEGQKFVTNREQVIELYKYFAKKYAIRFYDYSSDSICFDKTHFYNANHLNRRGVEIFSGKLAQDLKAGTRSIE